MSATQIMGQFFAFMSGPFGVAIIGICLVYAFLRLAAEHRLHYFVFAAIGGVGFFSVAWFMSTYFGASPG